MRTPVGMVLLVFRELETHDLKTKTALIESLKEIFGSYKEREKK